MFCGNCGTENPEGTQFCAGCGMDLGGGKKGKKAKVNINLKDRKTLIGLGAGVLALILLLALLFGGGAKGVAKKYVKAVINADYAKIAKLYPKKVINEWKEDMDMDKDDWKDYLADASEELEDEYKDLEDDYGGKLKVTYEIKDSWKLNKKDDDFEDIQDYYDDEYDAKVSAVQVVEFEVCTYAGTSKIKNTVRIILVKVGLSWYVHHNSPIYFVG